MPHTYIYTHYLEIVRDVININNQDPFTFYLFSLLLRSLDRGQPNHGPICGSVCFTSSIILSVIIINERPFS